MKTRAFGRLLSPLDIAHAAAYFASDASAVITGSVLDLVDKTPPDAIRKTELFIDCGSSDSFFVGNAELTVDAYPKATLTLTLFTLSLDKKWLNL